MFQGVGRVGERNEARVSRKGPSPKSATAISEENQYFDFATNLKSATFSCSKMKVKITAMRSTARHKMMAMRLQTRLLMKKMQTVTIQVR